MERAKNSVLALFGLKKYEEGSRLREHRYQNQYQIEIQHGDKDLLQRNAEPDIDRKARDYIDHVRQHMPYPDIDRKARDYIDHVHHGINLQR